MIHERRTRHTGDPRRVVAVARENHLSFHGVEPLEGGHIAEVHLAVTVGVRTATVRTTSNARSEGAWEEPGQGVGMGVQSVAIAVAAIARVQGTPSISH